MRFYQRASAAADKISTIIDDLMAHSPYHADTDLKIEVHVLLRELTYRQPKIMQLLIEDSSMKNTLEVALSKIPATRPSSSG